MFDIGWSELMVIGGVALVVIGPKDLPFVVRSVAGLVRKARGIAAEFQSSLTEIADQADLKELRKQLNREVDDVKSQLDLSEQERMLQDAQFSVGESIERAMLAAQPPQTPPTQNDLAPPITDEPAVIADEKPKKRKKKESA